MSASSEYDVIVMGGGPAGCGETGAKLLLAVGSVMCQVSKSIMTP